MPRTPSCLAYSSARSARAISSVAVTPGLHSATPPVAASAPGGSGFAGVAGSGGAGAAGGGMFGYAGSAQQALESASGPSCGAAANAIAIIPPSL